MLEPLLLVLVPSSVPGGSVGTPGRREGLSHPLAVAAHGRGWREAQTQLQVIFLLLQRSLARG